MKRRCWLQLTLGGVAVIAATSILNPLPRLMWNATASVPTGLYRITPGAPRQLGELVAVMPPEPLATYLADGGYLPRGVPLLKHVTALPGQRVCQFGAVISVDGRPIGSARSRDRRGRSLPSWSGCRDIGADELFFMNTNAPDSLDGRYFGPLPAITVLGRATPLWTDPPPQNREFAG